MALNGIPIDPSQCMGDSLIVLNNSFIELDSRTLSLSSYIGGSSGNLYTLVQDVSGDLYTLIQQTSSEGGLIVPVKFSFVGDGIQDTFGLTGTSLSNDPVSYRVTLNGVVQDPGVDFNIVGSNLVFTSPPPTGVTIVVVTADEFGNMTVALSGGDYQLRSLSATWNNTSTAVQTNSATWGSGGSSGIDTGVRAISANWQNTSTVVQTNSAQWASNVDTGVRALSSNWQNTSTAVQTNSAQWASNIDTDVRAISSSWVTTNTLNTNFLPLSGGTLTGATRINANLTVVGNLSATGTSYFANTVYSTTSALSVINIGNTGPAFYVGNNGTGDIASFYDLDQNVEVLHVGGHNGAFPNVGIKTSSPGETLTVSGTISASGLIYSQGEVIRPLSGVGGIVVNNSATNVTVLSVDSDYLSSQVTQTIQYFGTPDSFFSPLW